MSAAVSHSYHGGGRSSGRRKPEADVEEQSSPMWTLPLDSMLHIFGFLQPPCICRVASVCSRLSVVSSNGHLWRTMAAREPVFQQNHLFQQISEQVRLKKSLINNTEGAAANEDTLDWKALFRQYCYDFTLNPTAQLIDCRHLMDHPKPALVSCINVFTMPSTGQVLLVTGSGDAVDVWDIAENVLVKTFRARSDYVNAVQVHSYGMPGDFSPIIITAIGRYVKMWDYESATISRSITVEPARKARVNCMVLIYNPKACRHPILATGSRSVQMWDIYTGENLRTLRSWLVKNPDEDVIGLQTLERNGVHMLFSGTQDCVSVWDIVSGRCLRNIDVGMSYALSCFAVTKDYHGKNVVVLAASNDKISVWDVTTGEYVKELVSVVDNRNVRCMGICGQTLVCGLSDGYLKIYHIASGDYITTLIGHDAAITCLEICRGMIITGSLDRTTRVWQAQY